MSIIWRLWWALFRGCGEHYLEVVVSIVWSKLQFTIILCGLGNHPPAAAFLLIFFQARLVGWHDGKLQCVQCTYIIL